MPRHYLQQELYDLVRKDESIFEFLQAGSLDGIWYWDLEDQDHEWMSPAFWQTLGFDPARREHLAAEWQDLIDPGDLARAMENFQAHVADASHPYDQIVRYRHADGSTVWVRCRGIAIRDENGVARRMLGAHTDVTALKRAEAELARQKAEAEELRSQAETDYRELYERSPDMYASVDASTARVKVCNETLARRVGYAKSEIIGRPIFDLYHRDCMTAAEKAFRTFASTGRVDNVELSLRCRDGSKVPVLLNVIGVPDETGRIDHSISTWRDISELKRIEQLEVLTRQLRSANAELEEFASIVSHDLQEPLRMVASFSKILAEKLDDHEDEEVVRYLGFAREGAERMQAMVADLLRYARFGRGEVLTSVDSAEIVSEVLVDLDAAIQESSAEIDVGALPKVYFDRTQLRQVFANLIGNAIKFRGAEEPRIQVSARRDGRAWRFEVRDNGIGIEPRHAEKIFRMFQRLQDREAYDGSGIGLAICKKAVEANGGEIVVRPNSGAGATFSFTILDHESQATSEGG